MWIETRTADFDQILAKKLVMFIQHIGKDGEKHAIMAQQLSAATKVLRSLTPRNTSHF
jgi:hypothetical protein